MELAKLHRLSDYEEVIGVLAELSTKEGLLIASIGHIEVGLPLEMEPSLRPLTGQRIAILRTDIPNKSYLFRVLKQDPVG